MMFARRFTTAVAVLFAAAGSLAAQGAAQTIASGDPQVPAVAAPSADQTAVAPAAQQTTSQPVSLAPYEQNASVGVHATARGPVPLAPPRREKVGSNVALMIVGGAVLIVGAIVGGTAGTLMMVGGAVIGFIGLYRYLQ
jgi:hypothetical protein